MQERWDVVLRILTGPMSAMGDQTLRGPVVRIGANPGPGGFQLRGYRGLDHRHAVITAYDKATASIAPVGTAQVRMGPHANVRWQDIDPMAGPQYLSQGCAVHLGPVGRGCTFEFIRVQRLGVRQQGELLSANEEAVDLGVASAGAGVVQSEGPPPPAAFEARRVTRISSSTVPIWFAGGLLVMAAFAVTCIGAVIIFGPKDKVALGPEEEGADVYEYVTLDAADINPELTEGLASGFHDFVMAPNAEITSPDLRRAITSPDSWDPKFYEAVTASVQTHLAAYAVFRRLDQIKDEYAFVVEAMRDANLPEVFAGIPYLETRYRPDLQSAACAMGYWQFMPEVAHRLDKRPDVQLVVRDCEFADAPGVLWSPTADAPPPRVYRDAVYIDHTNPDEPKCRIRPQGCRVDDRMSLERSTRAAIVSLTEAWVDPNLRASGAAVQITIASHNAGYDDGRFGVRKRSNLLPAYMRWAQGRPRDELPLFYGRNLTTTTPEASSWGGSVLPPETQHYVYTIVAEHLLAVCYYATNYGDEEAFRPWRKYTDSGGYCSNLKIPTPADVR